MTSWSYSVADTHSANLRDNLVELLDCLRRTDFRAKTDVAEHRDTRVTTVVEGGCPEDFPRTVSAIILITDVQDHGSCGTNSSPKVVPIGALTRLD